VWDSAAALSAEEYSLLDLHVRRELAAGAVLLELGAERASDEVREAVRRHLRECEQCQESKRRFVSPSVILGSLAPRPSTNGLRKKIWNDIDGRPAAGIRARLLRRLGLGAT
jgi:hypothetical protein